MTSNLAAARRWTGKRTAPAFMLLCVASVTLSGCSRLSTGPSFPSGPFIQETVETPEPAVAQTPVARLEQQASGQSIAGYVGDDVIRSMSEKDRAEAAKAQFYALQFGRPGAPRAWTGDAGASGEVTVGPFISINSQDCREFAHSVTIAGSSSTNEGTSCRDSNGNWHPSTG